MVVITYAAKKGQENQTNNQTTVHGEGGLVGERDAELWTPDGSPGPRVATRLRWRWRRKGSSGRGGRERASTGCGYCHGIPELQLWPQHIAAVEQIKVPPLTIGQSHHHQSSVNSRNATHAEREAALGARWTTDFAKTKGRKQQHERKGGLEKGHLSCAAVALTTTLGRLLWPRTSSAKLSCNRKKVLERLPGENAWRFNRLDHSWLFCTHHFLKKGDCRVYDAFEFSRGHRQDWRHCPRQYVVEAKYRT